MGSSSPQFKLPCFWKLIQIISGELMATVGCKDWEQDVCFRLLDQTKEVVQGNRRVCISPSKRPGTELSCRASCQSCPWQADVPCQAVPGTRAGQEGAQHPGPVSRTPGVSMARMGLALPANTGAVHGALWGQLTPAERPRLPWGSCSSRHSSAPWLPPMAGHSDESLPSTAQLVLSHNRSFQTPHSTTNQAQLPCDRHTQLWWGSYSLSIMNSSCQEERRNKT